MTAILLAVLTGLCALGVLTIGVGERRPIDVHDVLARRWAILSLAGLAAAFAALLVIHDLVSAAI